MKIKVGKYILRSDEWNYWIDEIRTVEKGKHKGEEIAVRIAGYCMRLDKLFDDFVERTIRSDDAEDLATILSTLKDAEKACKALIGEAVEQGFGKGK